MMMLLDKGFYDYDYTRPKKRRILTDKDKEIWSDDKMRGLLGKAIDPGTGERIFGDRRLEAERMQKIVLEDIEKKGTTD